MKIYGGGGQAKSSTEGVCLKMIRQLMIKQNPDTFKGSSNLQSKHLKQAVQVSKKSQSKRFDYLL